MGAAALKSSSTHIVSACQNYINVLYSCEMRKHIKKGYYEKNIDYYFSGCTDSHDLDWLRR